MATIVTFITQLFKLLGLINYFKNDMVELWTKFCQKLNINLLMVIPYDFLDSYLYFET